ncbi:fructose-1,6-bisphosphatase [Enterococcus lactis]|nr:fructose-1,6-bisphosphatase [Enterococcus lactis]
MRDEEWFSEKILAEFDAKEEGSAIINGHTPVKVKKESHRSKQTEKHLLLTEVYPKLIKKTGIAGYSLLCNSYGFQIVTHYPFLPIEQQFAKNLIKRM